MLIRLLSLALFLLVAPAVFAQDPGPQALCRQDKMVALGNAIQCQMTGGDRVGCDQALVAGFDAAGNSCETSDDETGLVDNMVDRLKHYVAVGVAYPGETADIDPPSDACKDAIVSYYEVDGNPSGNVAIVDALVELLEQKKDARLNPRTKWGLGKLYKEVHPIFQDNRVFHEGESITGAGGFGTESRESVGTAGDVIPHNLFGIYASEGKTFSCVLPYAKEPGRNPMQATICSMTHAKTECSAICDSDTFVNIVNDVNGIVARDSTIPERDYEQVKYMYADFPGSQLVMEVDTVKWINPDDTTWAPGPWMQGCHDQWINHRQHPDDPEFDLSGEWAIFKQKDMSALILDVYLLVYYKPFTSKTKSGTEKYGGCAYSFNPLFEEFMVNERMRQAVADGICARYSDEICEPGPPSDDTYCSEEPG